MRNIICWQARSSVLLRHAAESPEDRVVHRREIVERVLLLSGILLPCFVMLFVMLSVMLSVISFTVIYCSSSSSFWVSCEVDGVDKDGVDEGGVDEARYCCMTECIILAKSWTCCSEKLGTDGSASGILTIEWSIERIDLMITAGWIGCLIDGLRSGSARGADCHRHTGPLVGWLYIWLDKAYLVDVATNCQGSNNNLILFYDVMDYCWLLLANGQICAEKRQG